MIPRAAIAALIIAAAFGGGVQAQSMAVDPNRPVRGSCGEVLQPLFATLRGVALTGPLARIEVEITTTQTDPRRATARAVSSRDLDQAGIDRVLGAFVKAYESAERDGCTGVLTRRSRWIVRKGDIDRLWAPDDPVTINRPVAATTLPDGRTRIELLDPKLAWSRLQSRGDVAPGSRCYGSDALRDGGALPPIAAMPRGTRYQVRFRLEPDGRVGVVRLPESVTPGSTLAAALDHYVRSARYYPQISEDCAPQASWLTIVAERS